MPESQWSFLYFCPSPTSISSPCNNYEYDTRKKEVDWTWLNACKGVVDGDPAPVAAYLTSGGSPTRTLTPIEVQILSRDSAFDVGHTLVHLAIRRLSAAAVGAVILHCVSSRPGLYARPFQRPRLHRDGDARPGEAVDRKVKNDRRPRRQHFIGLPSPSCRQGSQTVANSFSNKTR
ncbi:unnamed protein product, partial [Nesidiocoris tenuis]